MTVLGLTVIASVAAVACGLGLAVSLAIALQRWLGLRRAAEPTITKPRPVELREPAIGDATTLALPRRRISSALASDPTARAAVDLPVEATEVLPACDGQLVEARR